MAEHLTLDANILVYALDERNPLKQQHASTILEAALKVNALLVTITMGEFFWTVARKGFVPAAMAKEYLRRFATMFPIVPYGTDHMLRAADEVAAKRFSFWDAVMLATAEDAGCTICFSEDMADGARLGNITVRNPFGPKGLSDAAKTALGIA